MAHNGDGCRICASLMMKKGDGYWSYASPMPKKNDGFRVDLSLLSIIGVGFGQHPSLMMNRKTKKKTGGVHCPLTF